MRSIRAFITIDMVFTAALGLVSFLLIAAYSESKDDIKNLKAAKEDLNTRMAVMDARWSEVKKGLEKIDNRLDAWERRR